MKNLSDNSKITEFSIPGTHDSGALLPIPFAQTQKLSFANQLNNGIRFLDIRLRHYKKA